MDVSLKMRRRSGKCAYQTLFDSFLDFLDLDFGEAANLEQVLAVLCVNSLEDDGQPSLVE